MSYRIPHNRNAILAALAAAALACAPQAASTKAASTKATQAPSSTDSAYGRDTLWSSPYNQPAMPGTGLPNSSGPSQPGTGSPGSSGSGGTGSGGSGMGMDSSYGTPGKVTPAVPSNGGAAPRDSIGVPDWMERG